MAKAKIRCDQTIDAFGLVMDEKQVRETIKSLGWNQKEIAEYWNVSAKSVCALVKNKNGERNPRDDCAFRGLPPKK